MSVDESEEGGNSMPTKECWSTMRLRILVEVKLAPSIAAFTPEAGNRLRVAGGDFLGAKTARPF